MYLEFDWGPDDLDGLDDLDWLDGPDDLVEELLYVQSLRTFWDLADSGKCP